MGLRTSRTDLPICRRKGTAAGIAMLAADMKHRYMAGLWAGAEFPEVPAPGFGMPSVVAYVNEGRWVADCPSCNGSELVDPEENWFFCLSCFNREVANRPRHVVFPPGPFLAEIETALEERPRPSNRNWFPHETAAELVAENVLYLGGGAVGPVHAGRR